MSAQPAQQNKFNERTFRSEMSNYIKYLKCSWKMALEVAESCVAPPPDPDDAEALDLRRYVVYDLTTMIFEKMTLDYAAALNINMWTQLQQAGRTEGPG